MPLLSGVAKTMEATPSEEEALRMVDEVWVGCPVAACGMQAFQSEVAMAVSAEEFNGHCDRLAQMYDICLADLLANEVRAMSGSEWLGLLGPRCRFCGSEDHESVGKLCRMAHPYLLRGLLAQLALVLSKPSPPAIASAGVNPDYDFPDYQFYSHADEGAGGTGFAGSGYDQTTFKEIDNANDAAVAQILRVITHLLPNANVNVCFHELVLPILGSSPTLLPFLLSLLRNESFVEINARSELYTTAFNLLNKLSHPLLIYILLRHDFSSPLATLASQAGVFITTTRIEADCDVELAATVQQIAALIQQRIGEAKSTFASHFHSDSASRSTSNNAEAGTTYISTMRPLLFDEVKLDWEDHHFFSSISELSTRPSKARLRTLAKEIATLSTSLPIDETGGIFLRIDARRMDVMRACIIGPEDTPYERGAFLFDIFLPENYPGAPPKVQLTTTGHGSVRFNPNLYANGKVCLSLLGTWDGPGWDPEHSTLLQVLLSIRALIMVPDPWYNEPGRRLLPATISKANKYNDKIRSKTKKWAVKDHLNNPDPVFGDLIRQHIRLQQRVLAENPRASAYWRKTFRQLNTK